MKLLREFLGKAENVATLILVWRPFLRDLWAAVAAATASASESAPQGFVWTKQIQQQLLWFQQFLSSETGPIRRVFTLDAYLRRGAQVTMGFDASPWGIGGWLRVDGQIVSYFADGVTTQDQEILHVEVGSSSAQQVLEGLAILVGLRAWRTHWLTSRASLSVQSDNVAALSAVSNMRAHSLALNCLARELAFDLGEASFLPDEVLHVPGVCNGLADKLSRKHQPGRTWDLPHVLRQTPAVAPPLRDRRWYRCLSPSCASA